MRGIEEQGVLEVMDFGWGVGVEDDLDDVDARGGFGVWELGGPAVCGVSEAFFLDGRKVIGWAEVFVGGECGVSRFDFDEDEESLVGSLHDEVDLTAVGGAEVAQEEAVAEVAEVAFCDAFSELTGMVGGGVFGSGVGGGVNRGAEIVDEPAQTRGDGWGRGRGCGDVRGGGRCRNLCGMRRRIVGIVHGVVPCVYRVKPSRGCWRQRC